MTLTVFGVVLLVAAAALFLLVRIANAVRQWREPTTHWVRRAASDRRKRDVGVTVERRQGPRRQDEIARHFLDEFTPRRQRMRTAFRG